MGVKESWHITFADRLPTIVYTERAMLDVVNGRTDPRFFAGGTVTGVQYVINEWRGSWDDRPITRNFWKVYRATVNLDVVTEGNRS